MKFLRTPVALALLLNSPLFAQAQVRPVDATNTTDYVVTATRSPVAAADTVRPVLVITAEDIRQTGAATLSELLQTLGGVELTRNGGLGHLSSVFMRGAASEHTVVLLDGVRLGSATTGTAALEAIPLALIERVELLAGPSSSLYGSDAIGGVIQVFSRSVERSPGASLSATAGSNGLVQGTAALALRLSEQTQLSLGLNSLRSDGINATTPDNTYSHNPDRDGLRQRGAQVSLNHQFSAGQALGLNWLNSRSETHFDDGPGIDAYSDTLTEALSLNWQARWTDGFNSEVRVGRSRDESDDHSSFPGYFNTEQRQVSWLNRVALAGGTATVGLEWLRQSVDSSTVYTEQARTVRSGLLGWRGQFGAHSLQADLRQDRNSQFGDHSTGQLGWAFRVDEALRLRAAWGNAFHAPTFNLLYYPGFGKADLKPERSNSFDLGVDARWRGLDLAATLFENNIRDLIDYAPPTYEPANVASARIRGLALTAGGQLQKGLRAKLNLTVQDPQNDDTGMQLRRRAKVFGGLHLSQQWGSWQLGTDLSWVGKRYDGADESESSQLGAYGLVAVFGSWALSPEWRLEARVNNLTDRHYASVLTYNAPGREGQLTLRWTPGL